MTQTIMYGYIFNLLASIVRFVMVHDQENKTSVKRNAEFRYCWLELRIRLYRVI